MHSTKSIIIFVLIMTTIVSLLLSGMYTGLKDIHDRNELLYAKKATLSAIANHLEMDFNNITDEQVLDIFNNQIEQLVVNYKGEKVSKEEVEALGYRGGLAENVDTARESKKEEADRVLPLFVFTKSDGKKYYILSTRGKGLWDAIWGCVALEDDLSTIAGISFDHKAETPGLGAEIKDNLAFKKQFVGKMIYTPEGEFKSVKVMKGGVKNPKYEVDGISGATITGDGVTSMLEQGLKAYEPYFETVKG